MNNPTDKLLAFIESIQQMPDKCIGYPANLHFDYSLMQDLYRYPLNNVGDPMVNSTYKLSSQPFEREVIRFFAEMFRARQNEYWGYVTNGGSEGNLYSLYLARELYPKGMVYYSEATHYSVHKNIHLLNMPSIVIRSSENGEIDYDDLEHAITMNRHLPVIILANIGTTMTEARDDLSKINGILRRNAITKRYIHCDAALCGSYAPFITPRPAFDFEDGADSIAVSGHKFIGSPMPCGVVLVRKINRDRIARDISYIDSLDTTISGSRNGHTPLFLWYAIQTLGIAGLKAQYEKCLDLANYTLAQLQGIGIPAWKNEGAITVMLPAPDLKIRKKWQLATENGLSHVICMPGVNQQDIDHFVADLQKEK